MPPGKHRGMQRLADASGVFSMLAVDQRPPVEKLVVERRGTAVASGEYIFGI
jgi:tagatose 1,6-diphosphate aldolase